MELDLFYLYFSAALIWIISIWVYYKNRFLSLGNLYLFFYAVLFIFSIRLYGQDFVHDLKGLNLFGFLHFIFFICLFASPVLKLPRNDVPFVETNSKLVRCLYWFTIIFCLLGFYEIYQNFSSGVILLFSDMEYGNEAYMELREGMDVIKSAGRAYDVISVISGQAKWLSVFLFLYSLIDSKSTKLEKCLLGICVLSTFMSSMARGSRFGIIVSGMQFIFFYYLIRNYIPKALNRILQRASIIIGSVLIVAVVIISLSRAVAAGKEDSMFMFYDSYAGQSIIYYDKYAVDHGQDREGDRIMPFVKKTLGFSDVADSYAKRLRKYNQMKIDEVHFISFLGDFMLDFGFFFGNIILLVLVWFYRSKLSRIRCIRFPELCVLFMLVVTLNGFSHYVFTDTGGNMAFLMFWFLYLISKHSIKKRVTYDKKQI